MNQSRNFKVAIVGYGLAGSTFHAPLVKTTDGLELSAVVARSDEKQNQARSDFPEAEVIADFAELIQNASKFDLVVIATPNKEHVPQAMACLEAGLAVVVDKPLAINSDECKMLIDCSKKTKSLLSVFQNRRWDNDYLTVKRLIESGKLGKILRFESRFERYRPTARPGAWRERIASNEGGGVLFDLGSHLIDQATQLFGQPDQVYGEMLIRRADVLSDDDSFAALSFPSGVKAHIWTSAMSAAQGPRFRVLGTEGAYEKYGLDPQEDCLRAGKTPLDADWGAEPASCFGKLTDYVEGQKREQAHPTELGAYQSYYAGMHAALQETAPVPVDPRDALNTLRIIETARLSAERKTALSMTHS